MLGLQPIYQWTQGIGSKCNQKFTASFVCVRKFRSQNNVTTNQGVYENRMALKYGLASGPVFDKVNKRFKMFTPKYFCPSGWVYLFKLKLCVRLLKSNNYHDLTKLCKSKHLTQSYNNIVEDVYIHNIIDNAFINAIVNSFTDVGCLLLKDNWIWQMETWRFIIFEEDSYYKWNEVQYDKCNGRYSILCQLTVTRFSDKEKQECPANQFKCETTTSCIMKSLVCNGIHNCEDASDEINCNLTCEMRPSKALVSSITTYTLNEEYCKTSCHADNCSCLDDLSYQCPSGGCIKLFQLCDGVDDCKSDESSEMPNNILDIDFSNLNSDSDIPESDLKCGRSDNNIKGNKMAHYFRQDQLCVIEYLNKTRSQLLCPAGSHMKLCPVLNYKAVDPRKSLSFTDDDNLIIETEMPCMEKYRCRDTAYSPPYCLPLHYVCDGFADCPGI